MEVIDASSNGGGSVIFTSPLGAVMEVPANTLSEVGHIPITYTALCDCFAGPDNAG